MKKLIINKKYELKEVVDIISTLIKDSGYTNENYSLYVKKGEMKYAPTLICFVGLCPTISDSDEEIYPEYVSDNNFEVFYDGNQFEDVISNVLHQKGEVLSLIHI